MQIRKLIEQHIRRTRGRTNVSSDVQATVAANVGERNAVTRASSAQASSTQQNRARRSSGSDEAA